MAAWIVWLILAGVLLIAEMATFTFYLLWLGLGALAGALIAFILPGAWPFQIIAACIVAVALTFFGKPLTSRMQGKKGYRDAVDELVGKKGEVVEAIDIGSMGIVRIGTETWSATADERIEAGETVIVERRGTAVVHVIKFKEV